MTSVAVEKPLIKQKIASSKPTVNKSSSFKSATTKSKSIQTASKSNSTKATSKSSDTRSSSKPGSTKVPVKAHTTKTSSKSVPSKVTKGSNSTKSKSKKIESTKGTSIKHKQMKKKDQEKKNKRISKLSNSTTLKDMSPNTTTTNRSHSDSTLVNSQIVTNNIKKSDTIIEDIVPQGMSRKDFINTYNWDVAHNKGKSHLLHYYQLPFPWRENKFIINGYRFYDSYTKCLLSIFDFCHNETLNIWTHLLGFFYLLYIAIFSYPKTEIWNSPLVPSTAKGFMYFFLLAAMKCMLSSVCWHTFAGTSSYKLRPKFCCVDYTGITVLITASIMTAEYVTLSHSPKVMVIYMVLSSLLGSFGIYINWSPKFDGPEARPLRIKFFCCLASMGLLSFIHLIFTTSLSHALWLLNPVVSKSSIYYCIGVVFYGSFFPEKFRTDYILDKGIPNAKQLSHDLTIITEHKATHFRSQPTINPKWKSKDGKNNINRNFKSLWWVDYVGQSHTLWHIFVVLGATGHYEACLKMFAMKWLVN